MDEEDGGVDCVSAGVLDIDVGLALVAWIDRFDACVGNENRREANGSGEVCGEVPDGGIDPCMNERLADDCDALT